MAVPVDTFFLDPETHGTLQARIQQMVAGAILSGRLQAGEKLPSSRKLAQHLSVSRITVTLAYAELVANDYLTARGRSGYFVSDTAPRPPAIAPEAHQGDAVDWQTAIAQRFTGAPLLQRPENWSKFRYPFIYGQVDPTLFDHSSWRLCAVRALGQKDFDALTAVTLNPANPFFLGSVGTVDANGGASATLQVPPVALLSGFTLYAGGLTADPANFPQARTVLNEAVAIPIQ